MTAGPLDHQPAAGKPQVTRAQADEEGSYLWEGEYASRDNEILMGWYIAAEGAVRAKGTMYSVIHRHGINMSGRWVGLSYDGPVIAGWAAIAKSQARCSA